MATGLALVCLLAVSLPFQWRRIKATPWPRDAARYDHHMGDGSTEIGVLNAHRYWMKYGYAASAFLPCIQFSEEADAGPFCVPYTHYPPGPYLYSSALLSIFGWKLDQERALRSSRWFTYFSFVAMVAVALGLLATRLELGLAATAAVAGGMAFTRAFIIFSDNLFGHGLVLGLQGIMLGLILCWRPSFLWWWALLAALALIFTVELIPALFLLPCLLFFSNCMVSKAHRAEFRRILFCSFGIFLTAMLARFAQNALFAGSLSAAWQDWFGIVVHRVTGRPIAHQFARTGGEGPASFTWMEFIYQWLRYQTLNLRTAGAVAFLGALAILLARRHWAGLKLLACIYFACLAWNFLFWQHTWHHLFTVRYVVWPFAFSLGLALSDWRRGSSR